MRIVVGGIFHESNGFSPVRTAMDAFDRGFTNRAREIFTKFENAEWETAGCLDAAKAHPDVELIGALHAWAWPSGPIEPQTFRGLLDELVQRVVAAKPDGVVLLLHGAMLAAEQTSADATIVREVREAVGQQIPLGVAMDFHANVDPAFVGHCDLAVGYDTYPHVDLRRTGRLCTELVIRSVRGQIDPRLAVTKVPLVPHILKQETGGPPMRELMEMARLAENEEGILSVSVFGGFFWADVPHAGMTVLAVTDRDEALARQTASRIASATWQRRAQFQCFLPAAADAVRQAIAANRGPVILVDLGDNVGGGTPGDGTTLLAELIRQQAQGAVLVIADPESVQICQAAGVGATGGSSCRRKSRSPARRPRADDRTGRLPP